MRPGTLTMTEQVTHWTNTHSNQPKMNRQIHRTVISGRWPDFPSQDRKLFKSGDQSRWLTKGNQNIKEDGLNGNVSNVTTDARRPCPEFIYLLLCCCSGTNRLLLSPTSSRLSNPLWQDSWPRSWGKADLDIGPIPDNQIRTSAALLTTFYF